MALDTSWLEEDNTKIILAEVEYHDGEVAGETGKKVFYFSNYPYIVSSTDSSTNSLGESIQDIAYEDILNNIPIISTSVDAADALGTLEVLNTTGEFDEFVTYAWIGHKVLLFLGDPSWNRSQFEVIFDGVVSGLSANQQFQVNIEIKDKQEILNVIAQTELLTSTYIQSILDAADDPAYFSDTISGTSPDNRTYNASTPSVPDGVLELKIPICLGKVFNISPILIDAYNHVYLIHQKSIVSITEVRSDGVPLVSGTDYEEAIDLDDGGGNYIGAAIRLLVHPQSTQITCDVLGEAERGDGYDSGYTNTIHSATRIIEWLALEKTILTKDDLCPMCFGNGAGSFPNTDPLGIYITTDTTVHEILEQISITVGGYHRINRLGYLQFEQFIDPDGETPDFYLGEDDIIEKSLLLQEIENPVKSLTYGYQKNWTIQDLSSIAGTIVATSAGELDTAHSFTAEFSEIVKSNVTDSFEFPLAEEAELLPTLFWLEADAQDELDRRAGLRDSKRFIYKIETTTAPLSNNIGDIVNITYSRYGFDTGTNGLIIGMEEFPIRNRVNLEVWL